ncbi:MAG: hypothetical protein PVJ80_07985 [Gemmatimonadota bacterium]|jgi:hypothetical protein
MSTAPQSRAPDPNGLHVATIAHDGFLWDAYLELDGDPRRPTSFRGRLRFDVAGAVGADGGPRSAQTTVIIIEDSYEEAVAKARAMDDRVLENLLRSALPDEA